MKYLVFCTCGHVLDRHDAVGCGGDGRIPCRCPRNQEQALESAIDSVRSHPWESAGHAERLPSAEIGLARII
ncbi:MAG: hypothetical protein JOZ86_02175 [Candidatus Eremiobacteraeota bacterium]|nr:hypothetical protein [Candidatus Eremiobacteraeota bacterium]